MSDLERLLAINGYADKIEEKLKAKDAEIERLTAEVTHYAQAYHREMVANKKLQAVVDAASSDLDKEAADEIERLKNELRACKSSCKWYVHEIATLKAEIERLRTDLELDKYAIGHYRDQIAKLQAVVDAAIAWANTDQNDIDECDKTNLELLDAVTEYEMSIAALKEADND